MPQFRVRVTFQRPQQGFVTVTADTAELAAAQVEALAQANEIRFTDEAPLAEVVSGASFGFEIGGAFVEPDYTRQR